MYIYKHEFVWNAINSPSILFQSKGFQEYSCPQFIYLRKLNNNVSRLLLATDYSDKEEDENTVNMDLIYYIQQKQQYLINIAKDPSHVLSERLLTLANCSFLSSFIRDAKKEEAIIFGNESLDIGVLPHEYVKQILNQLTVTRKRDEDDIFDFGGKSHIETKIRKLNSMFDTVRYVLFTEILTKYIMDERKCSYIAASKTLYSGLLPTTHHVESFLSVSKAVYLSSSNDKCVDGQSLHQLNFLRHWLFAAEYLSIAETINY